MIKAQPYNVTGRNCMDSTFDILRAYGAALPDIKSNPGNWAPINWFKAINARPFALMHPKAPIDVSFYEHENLEGTRHDLAWDETYRVSNLHEKGWGDFISSIVVRSGYLAIFEHVDFGGRYVKCQAPTVLSSLNGNGWNDIVSSFIASDRPI